MEGKRNSFLQSRNSLAIILGLVLFGLTSSLIIVSCYSNNNALGQKQDGISPGPESPRNNSITNSNPLISNQVTSFPQQALPSGFIARGTINSVIIVPTGKWLAVGNWSMTLNEGNVTIFDIKMTWYNSNGTAAHTHELANFRMVEGEQVVSLEQPTNNIKIKGVADVGTNNQISWNEVPITISINGHKIVTISVDDNKTNHHFAGQPILGIVSSFVPCSDLPLPDMEILPPCTVGTFVEDNFDFANDTLSSESIVPSQNGTFNECSLPSEEGLTTEGSFPSEDALSQSSLPSQNGTNMEGSFPAEEGVGPQKSLSSEDAQQCSELNIKNVSSSGFEDDPSDYHPPFDAIDGNSSTWWSNQDKNSWLQLDLGDTNTLCGIAVEWNKGDTREYNFEIEASTDGNDFKKVFEGKNKVGSSILETYPIEGIKAHYVKLAITGTSSKDGWVSIKEIKVNGRPMT
jgi:hypothetical protein